MILVTIKTPADRVFALFGSRDGKLLIIWASYILFNLEEKSDTQSELKVII